MFVELCVCVCLLLLMLPAYYTRCRRRRRLSRLSRVFASAAHSAIRYCVRGSPGWQAGSGERLSAVPNGARRATHLQPSYLSR